MWGKLYNQQVVLQLCNAEKSVRLPWHLVQFIPHINVVLHSTVLRGFLVCFHLRGELEQPKAEIVHG